MGGTDFQDIMFCPIANTSWEGAETCPERVASRFSHDKEYVEPGYYRVSMLDTNIEAELTATQRCGMHRYNYPTTKNRQIFIDLQHGSEHACTIIPEDDFDTVRLSQCVARVSATAGPPNNTYIFMLSFRSLSQSLRFTTIENSLTMPRRQKVPT